MDNNYYNNMNQNQNQSTQNNQNGYNPYNSNSQGQTYQNTSYNAYNPYQQPTGGPERYPIRHSGGHSSSRVRVQGPVLLSNRTVNIFTLQQTTT